MEHDRTGEPFLFVWHPSASLIASGKVERLLLTVLAVRRRR